MRLDRKGFYRFTPGPPGAPTVVLLHGWTSTAEVTWHGVFDRLSEHYQVLAPDLRGHGRGPYGTGDAALDDVASDVIGFIESRRAGPAILVGYSLGGVIAQIVARARPDLLRGVVLCASASRVCDARTGRLGSVVLGASSRVVAAVPDRVVRLMASGVMRFLFGNSDFERWSRARTSSHSWSEVLSIGADLFAFDSRPWIEELTVPAAVVITTSDRFVSPEDQRLLARAIGAPEVSVDGDHSICLAQPDLFADALLEACDRVRSSESDLSATA